MQEPSMHERLESLKYLGGPMNLVFDESCKLKVKNFPGMLGRKDYDTTIRWNRNSGGMGSLENALWRELGAMENRWSIEYKGGTYPNIYILQDVLDREPDASYRNALIVTFD